jgi:hypothetical protein
MSSLQKKSGKEFLTALFFELRRLLLLAYSAQLGSSGRI